MPAMPRRPRGASLIEVLIAVLVLAIGSLGVAAMQSVSLRNSQSALERTQAAVLTYSALDTLRANRNVARQGFYNMALTCEVPESNGSLVQDDLEQWMTSVHGTINAAACGSITCTTTTCTVVVRWDDARATGGDDELSVTTTSRI